MKNKYFGGGVFKTIPPEKAEAMPAAIITAIVSSLLLLGMASVVSLVITDKAESEEHVALTTAASNIDVSLRSDITQASYLTASAKLKQPANRLLTPTDVLLNGTNLHIPAANGNCKVIRWKIDGNTASRELTIYQNSLTTDTLIKCNETSPVIAKRTKVFAQNLEVKAPFQFSNQVGRELSFIIEESALETVNTELERKLNEQNTQRLSDAEFNKLNSLMIADSYNAAFQNPEACALNVEKVNGICPPAETDTVTAAWNSLKISKISVHFQMQDSSGAVAQRDIAQNASVPLYADAAEAEAAVAGSRADNRPVAPQVSLSTNRVILGSNYTINWTNTALCPVDTVRTFKLYENNSLIKTQSTAGFTKNYTNSATEYLNYHVQVECVRGALVVNSDMSAPGTAKVIPAVPVLNITNQPAVSNAALNSNLAASAVCLYGTAPRYNVEQASSSYGTPGSLSDLANVNRPINSGLTVVEGARYQYRVEAWCVSPYDKSALTNKSTNVFTTLVNAPASPSFTYPLDGATNIAPNATVTWGAVTCPLGTTPRYYSTKNINAGAAITPTVIDNWTTDVSLVSSNTQGNRVGYTVAARCNGTAVVSASSAPDSVFYTTLINTPSATVFTSPAEGATGVPTNALVSWNAIACPTATTTQYYSTKNMNAGGAITPIVIDNWTTDVNLVSNNNQGNKVGYTVAVRCAGPNAVSAQSGTASLTYTTTINAPAAPVFISPAEGATRIATNATVTWSSVACATGTTAQYYTTKNMNAGAAITPIVIDNWTVGNTLATSNTQGNRVGYTVAARCIGPNAVSGSTATDGLTYTTVINIPAAPSFTAPLEGATNIATNAAVTWSTAVCAASTTTQYYVTKNKDRNVILGTPTVIKNWGTGTSIVTNNTEGNTVGYTVAARCVGPNAVSGSSGTDTLSYTTIMNKPATPAFTAPLQGAVNVATNVTVTWGAVTCASGGTVQYYTTKNINAGASITPIVIDNWTTDLSLISNNTQGNRVGYTVAARCVGPNATSGSSATGTLTYTTLINAPAAPTFTAPADNATGVSTSATVTWTAVTCAVGTTTKYYTTKNVNNGVSITPIVIDNWTTDTSLVSSNNQGSTVGYTVKALCDGPNYNSSQTATDSLRYTTRILAPAMPAFIMPSPADNATKVSPTATLAWTAVTCATGATAQFYTTKDINGGKPITPIVIDNWNGDTSYTTYASEGHTVRYTATARCVGPNATSANSPTDYKQYTTLINAPGAPNAWHDNWGSVYWNAPSVGCAAATSIQYRIHQTRADGNVVDAWGGWGTGTGSGLPTYNTGGYPQWAEIQARCVGPNDTSAGTMSNTTKWIKRFNVSFGSWQAWRRINVTASCPFATSVGPFHLYVAADGWGGARGWYGGIQTDEGAWIADAQAGGGGNTGWLYMTQQQNTQWDDVVHNGTTYHWGYWGNSGWGSHYSPNYGGSTMSGTYWNASGWGSWAYWYTGRCESPYMHTYAKGSQWHGGWIRNAGDPGAHYNAWPQGYYYTQAGVDATR